MKATNHFLSPSDIENIGIQVKEYLATAAFVVAMDSSRNVLGFMGMTQSKIDSLFIHPKFFGKGVGKFLMQHAESVL